MNRSIIKHYDESHDTLFTYDLDIDYDNVVNSMKLVKRLTSNDSNSSYSVEGMMKISGIMYSVHKPAIKTFKSDNVRIVIETFNDHIEKLQKLPESNYRWIYNIIDGKAEHDDIISQTSEYILLNDYTWDSKHMNELHMLGILCDKHLKSVREITYNNTYMLLNIKYECLNKIKEIYNVDSEKIKVYFHYPPSTYQLHIHFVHIDKCDQGTSFEKCIAFDDVIKNIRLNPNYYHGDMTIRLEY